MKLELLNVSVYYEVNTYVGPYKRNGKGVTYLHAVLLYISSNGIKAKKSHKNLKVLDLDVIQKLCLVGQSSIPSKHGQVIMFLEAGSRIQLFFFVESHPTK